MRRLLVAFALMSLPPAPALAEEEALPEPAETPLPFELPPAITPETLDTIAEKLDQLSRDILVSTPGGRRTAAERRALSSRTLGLSRQLSDAAEALESAQISRAAGAAQLVAAQQNAMSATLEVASNVPDPAIRQQLYGLLETPPADVPDPITHIFCMEAAGAGPNTFERYAVESLTQSLPYVQGYITHDVTLPARNKLRLSLTVEPDAGSAAFAAIDALRAANKTAVEEMDDPGRRPSETIMMDGYAETLCSPTGPLEQ